MGVERSVERREMLNIFNYVETERRGHAAAIHWLQTGACTTRAGKESGCETDADREDKWDRDGRVAVYNWLSRFSISFYL
jgi:hypothetical protein